MRIVKARIENFKSISELEFTLNKRVNTLVGANESGKSNILKALSKINTDKEYAFEQNDETRLFQHPRELPKVSCKFELDLTEREELQIQIHNLLGETNNNEEINIINSLKFNFVQVTKEVINKNFQEYGYTVILDYKIIDELNLSENIKNKIKLNVINYIKPIVYFTNDNVSLLSSVVTLKEIHKRPGIQPTIVNLLKLGGFSLEGFLGDPYDSQSNLHEVERVLNEIFPTWWKQDPSIKFRLYFDRDNNLNIHIEDSTSSRETPESRSEGVQWFMAFMIKFLAETKGFENKGSILLFDELGLHLHPKGQRDLQTLIEELSNTNQIIYTTHFPYLINQNYPERILLVTKERASSGKAKIGTNINAKPYIDMWKNLRSSIGLMLGDSFSVSEKTLIVEGPTDIFALRALNNLFKIIGKENFESDEIGLFSGCGTGSGIINSITFCLSQNLKVAVLLDGDKAGKDAQKGIAKYDYLQNVKTLLLSDFYKNKGDFTIENIIPEELYFHAINNFYKVRKEKWETFNINNINVEPDKKFVDCIKDHLEKITGFGKYDKVGVMREVANILDDNPIEIYNNYAPEFDKMVELIREIKNLFRE